MPRSSRHGDMQLCAAVMATIVGYGLSFHTPVPSSMKGATVRTSRHTACCIPHRLRGLVRLRASIEGSEEVSIGWQRSSQEQNEPTLPAGVMPCIPVPAARMSLPGELREVHLYDTSNLEVLRHALKHTGGYYVQAVIDPGAMAERRFRLCKYGVLCKVVGQNPGIHRNNVGERSDSVRARVLSMSRVLVGDVMQNEPFVAAQVAAGPLEYLTAASQRIAAMEASFNQCEQLRLRLGMQALKGTPFQHLSDLPDLSGDEESDPAAPSQPTPSASDEPAESLTPQQLRALVQQRVADAAKDGLTTSASDAGLSDLLHLGGERSGADEGAAVVEAVTASATPGKENDQELQRIVARVFREVATDGRRTKPGAVGSIGPTTPFLLPSPYSERESLLVLAAMRYVESGRRLEAFSVDNGMDALQAAMAGLDQAQRRLSELALEWER